MKTWLITEKNLPASHLTLHNRKHKSDVLEDTERELPEALLQRHPFLIQPLEKRPSFFGAFLLGGEAGN